MEPSSATGSTKTVVVVRHGERLDYVMRDAGQNWIPTSTRPWDPPLTERGIQQAKTLGDALPRILEGLELPPIAAVYSSPFLRCQQTAVGLTRRNLNVKVELGLAESMNENWYRSWAIPGTDGTWGYKKQEMPLSQLDVNTLHPACKESLDNILDWKLANLDDATASQMDQDYTSRSSIDRSYSMFPPHFESFKMQRERMKDTLELLSTDHLNETFVLVSHGGPVTHLYESLTRNNWDVHGESKYCCYSIYHQSEGELEWKPLVVNQVLEPDESQSPPKEQELKPKTFTWA